MISSIFRRKSLGVIVATLLGIIGLRSAPAVEMNADERELAMRLTGHAGQHRDRSRMHADPILMAVARARAEDMATRRYVAHVNPDGIGPNALVRAAGYALPAHWGGGPGQNFIESIGAGYKTAELAWEGWMHSSSHRTHLLASSSFYRDQTNFGIAAYTAPGSPYRRYWVIITAPPATRGLASSDQRRWSKSPRVAVALPVWRGIESDEARYRARATISAPRPTVVRMPSPGRLVDWQEAEFYPRPRG